MLFWGLGLLAIGLLLVIVEVFVPSGGLITVVAVGSSVAGVYCLFRHDTAWGVAGLGAMLLLGPMFFMFALKIWPSTPIGRRMMGEPSPEVVEAQRQRELARREQYLALLGAEAQVITDLRPVGIIEIDGQRYDALAQSSFVARGSKVKVTAVEGTQIRVRPVI